MFEIVEIRRIEDEATRSPDWLVIAKMDVRVPACGFVINNVLLLRHRDGHYSARMPTAKSWGRHVIAVEDNGPSKRLRQDAVLAMREAGMLDD